MNPAIKMVATIIVAAIITTLAVLVGMIILGLVPGHEHHTSMPTNSSIEARGGHHK